MSPHLRAALTLLLGIALPTCGAFADGGRRSSASLARLNMASPGRLEELKQQEAALARQLAAIRIEKRLAVKSRPLTIGVVGFGRFGQFISRTFAKHGRVVVTSRSDYTAIAEGMGVTYVPLDDPDAFLSHNLDVVIVAVSILSFESTVAALAPALERYPGRAPLVVDVLSVKEHPRQVMLQKLPAKADILSAHPMFGPDSGKNGWQNLNFVYEKTRIDGYVLDPDATAARARTRLLQREYCAPSEKHEDVSQHVLEDSDQVFRDARGDFMTSDQDHVEANDRIERFLSIWEEEGCRMVPMSCKAHDEYAANSQFITHLMGRILDQQDLKLTPIDTKGFQSVLKLVDSTTADSFDLFYGLYKYNSNSVETIKQLQAAMEDVIQNLQKMEQQEREKMEQQKQQHSQRSKI